MALSHSLSLRRALHAHRNSAQTDEQMCMDIVIFLLPRCIDNCSAWHDAALCRSCNRLVLQRATAFLTEAPLSM